MSVQAFKVFLTLYIYLPMLISRYLAQSLGSQQNKLNCSAYASDSTYTANNSPYRERLHACFQANTYDTSQVPIQMATGVTQTYLEVDFSFAVVNLLQFDNGDIKLFYQLALQWYDFHRQWDYTEVPVKYIEVPLSEIWYPRVQFVNTARKSYVNIMNDETLKAQVYYNSLITVFVNNIIEGSCEIDLTNFPFDTQICTLEFRFQRYFFDTIDVVIIRKNTSYLYDKLLNDEWIQLNESSVALNFSTKMYSAYANGSSDETSSSQLDNFMTGIQARIALKRLVTYYVVNLYTSDFALFF